MIRFHCNQCGKPFERSDDTAGSLVFCACGAANRVPWPSESLPSPPAAEASPRRSPSGEQRVPDFDPPRYPHEPEVRRRDPAYCFNHTAIPRQHTCSACGEGFCADCVVVLQGQTLCGPCKNFRIRELNRPPRVSALAIVAPILALVAGPVTYFMLLICIGSQPGASAVTSLAFVGLLCQLLAVLLAVLSLRNQANDPRLGGRALAITGLVAALTASLMTIELAINGLALVE